MRYPKIALFAALATLAFLMLAPFAAYAQTYTATLSGVTFYDGHTASGSFSYDPATGVIFNSTVTLSNSPSPIAMTDDDYSVILFHSNPGGTPATWAEIVLVDVQPTGTCSMGSPCGPANYLSLTVPSLPTASGSYPLNCALCSPPLDGGAASSDNFSSGSGSAITAGSLSVSGPNPPFQPGKQLGNTCSCVGDPIDTASGNVYEQATDYTTTGQNPLAFQRYYNSRSTAGLTTFAVSLGINWRTNYDRYLQLSSSKVIAERADGKQLTFTLTSGAWVSDGDIDVTLTNSGSTWTLTDHDDTIETYTAISSSEALLNTIAARNGYTQTLAYNGSNQLTSVTDSYSRSLTLTYSSGRLSTVATPDSTTLTYGYTAGGSGYNLTSVTFPTSPSTALTYAYGASSAPPNALTSITDENGHTFTTWTYDSNGRGLTSQLGSGADLTTLTYNDTTGSRTATNALGVTDTYSFTPLQGAPKMSGISRAATSNTAAATRAFTYDSNGFLASATDWNGNQTTYVNDAHGDPTTINEAVGSGAARTTTITYDSTFVHEPASIATSGMTTAFTYQTGTGNVLTRTDTDTTTTSTPYSTNGQTRTWTYTWSNFLLTSVQNPRTDVTAVTNYAYGTDGALTSITDPMSHVTSITSHTGGGRPLTIVDPNSVTTTLTYDPRQRLTSSSVATSAGARTTTYTIDPTGLIAKVTLPDSSYLSYTYDTAHRLTQVTNALGDYFKFTLDALGDRTVSDIYKSTNVLYRQHTATFDNLGRMLTDVGGMSQTTTYSSYDNNGNPQTITDPRSHATTQVFDALNRLSQITDANSGVTGFAFDAHDRTTSVTNANSNATAYVFDGSGDVIQQTSPDSGVTVFHYDGDGNLTQKVDALSVTTNQTFDKADRILTRSYPADSTQYVGYTYDKSGGLYGFGIGRLGTVSENSTASYVNLNYDERGNLLATRRYTSGGTNISNLWAGYDAASRISGYTYSDGTWSGYSRDAAGYITKVALLPNGSSTYQTVAYPGHHPFGLLHYLTFGNGIGEGFTIDEDYRITNVTDTGTAGTLRNVTYGHDAADNVTSLTDAILPLNSQTLGFDVINRLTSATSGTGGYGSLAWTYDKVGNLQSSTVGSTTTTYGYTSGSNRLASITQGGTTTVSTNANGNITSIPPANSGTAATFAYNVTNRLASVTGTSPAASFVTDSFGRRYSKTDSGSTPITYLYDFSGRLVEENNSGSITDYIYSDGRPVAVFVPGGSAGTLYFVHTDPQGTPQMVTNSLQVPVWATTYQPYGTTGTVVSGITQNLRFPGQNFDLETGFNYNLNRDYMPNLGRYLESDPVGLAGGLNTFLYANANPGKFTDRLGLEGEMLGSFVATSYGLQVANEPATQRAAELARLQAPLLTDAQRVALAEYLGEVERISNDAAAGSVLVGQPEAFATFEAIAFCAGSGKNLLKPNPVQQGLNLSADEIAKGLGVGDLWSVVKVVGPPLLNAFVPDAH